MEKVNKKGDSDIKKEIAELTGKMDHKTLAIWATDCAEHVLSYFEEKYPNDDRPRKAVEAGRAWVRGEIKMSEARTAAFAAHAAARDVDEGVTLEQLSGGMLVLGVSSGDRPFDFPAFGVPYEERSEVFRQSFDYFRKLLTPPFPEIDSPFGRVRSGESIVQPQSAIPTIIVGPSAQTSETILSIS
jgi:hypothetical protein